MNRSESNYRQWMREVDAILMSKIGLGQRDLCDGPSRDSFEDEMTPDEYIETLMLDWNDMDLDTYEEIFGK